MKSFGRAIATIVRLVYVSLSMAGCAAFNPYLDPPEPRPGIARDVDGRIHTSSVSVDDATLYGRSISDAYTRRLNDLSAARVTANTGMISMALAALGVAATGGASQATTILGLMGVGLGAAGSQVLVAAYRPIYMEGSTAIECSIGAAQAKRSGHLAFIGITVARQMLFGATGTLDTRVEEAAQRASHATDPIEQQKFGQFIDEARTTNFQARTLLEASAGAEDDLDPLGQILLSQVESIRIRVNAEVAKAEPDLLSFNQALRDQLLNAAAPWGKEVALGKLAAPEPPRGKNDKGEQTKPDLNGLSPEASSAAMVLINATDLVAFDGEKLVNAINANVATPAKYDDVFKSCAYVTPGGASQKPPESKPADQTPADQKPAKPAADAKDTQVEKVQTFLAGQAANPLGANKEYDPGPINGKMSDKTRKAALAFLTANFDQIDAALRPASKDALKSAKNADLIRMTVPFLPKG